MLTNITNTAFGFEALHIPAAALQAYRDGRAAAVEHRYEEAIVAYTTSLAVPELLPAFRARVYEQRGDAYWLLSNYAAAEKDFQLSLTCSDDPVQIARARVRLADVADSYGHFDQALALYEQGLKEAIAANDFLAIGRAHRGVGIVNRRQGDVQKSLNHLTQALAIFRQLGNAREQARALTSLGLTHHARGEYQQAISTHDEARRIFESLHDRWRVILSLNSIGECHQSLYDIETAYQYHRRALQLAQEYKANSIHPDILRNLGVDLMELGQMEEAIGYLEQALQDARRLDKKEQEALVLYFLARAYIRQWKLEAAEAAVQTLSDLMASLKSDRFRAYTSFVRGELLFARGKKAEALPYLQSATLEAQTALDRGSLWKLHAAISHMVENPAIAKVHLRIAADFIRQTAEPLQDPRLKEAFVNAAPVMAVLVETGIDPKKL